MRFYLFDKSTAYTIVCCTFIRLIGIYASKIGENKTKQFNFNKLYFTSIRRRVQCYVLEMHEDRGMCVRIQCCYCYLCQIEIKRHNIYALWEMKTFFVEYNILPDVIVVNTSNPARCHYHFSVGTKQVYTSSFRFEAEREIDQFHSVFISVRKSKKLSKSFATTLFGTNFYTHLRRTRKKIIFHFSIVPCKRKILSKTTERTTIWFGI